MKSQRTLASTHLQFAQENTQTKNCKRASNPERILKIFSNAKNENL